MHFLRISVTRCLELYSSTKFRAHSDAGFDRRMGEVESDADGKLTRLTVMRRHDRRVPARRSGGRKCTLPGNHSMLYAERSCDPGEVVREPDLARKKSGTEDPETRLLKKSKLNMRLLRRCSNGAFG